MLAYILISIAVFCVRIVMVVIRLLRIHIVTMYGDYVYVNMDVDNYVIDDDYNDDDGDDDGDDADDIGSYIGGDYVLINNFI